MKLYDWFVALDTNHDEYLSADELSYDTVGLVETTSGSSDYAWSDICEKYFSDFPQVCHDLDLTEEDIAPEDFIKDWYSFDWDHDEIATE